MKVSFALPVAAIALCACGATKGDRGIDPDTPRHLKKVTETT